MITILSIAQLKLVYELFLYLVFAQAEDFKCYTCSSVVDDFCGDSDALIAKGSDAMMNCSANSQCFYQRVSK